MIPHVALWLVVSEKKAEHLPCLSFKAASVMFILSPITLLQG